MRWLTLFRVLPQEALSLVVMGLGFAVMFGVLSFRRVLAILTLIPLIPAIGPLMDLVRRQIPPWLLLCIIALTSIAVLADFRFPFHRRTGRRRIGGVPRGRPRAPGAAGRLLSHPACLRFALAVNWKWSDNMRKRTISILILVLTWLSGGPIATAFALEGGESGVLWFPIADVGPEWQATVTLRNLESREGVVALTGFPSPSGSSDPMWSVTLGPHAVSRFEPASLGLGIQALKVESALRLEGAIQFRARDGRETEFAAIERGSDRQELELPMDATVVVLNPDPETASMAVHLLPEKNLLDRREVNLGPGSVKVLDAASGLPDDGRASRTIELSSDREFLAAGVRLDRAAGTLEFFAPTLSGGPRWSWPLENPPRTAVGQDYAEYNVFRDRMFHAGWDMGAAWGTAVTAAADGVIVKIQQNGGCTRTCEDHGLGNAVIVRHNDNLSGQRVHSLYAHLQQIESSLLSSCGPVDAGKTRRRTCRQPVPVRAGQRLGKIGSSGYGSDTRWGATPHLHFEVRNFDTLGARGDDSSGTEIGYSAATPDTARSGRNRYQDPGLRFHDVRVLSSPIRVKTTQAAHLRIAPGGYGSLVYRAPLQLRAQEEFDAISTSAERNGPYCASEWYQIRRWDGSYFIDDQYRPGEIPDGWVCKDSLAVGSGSGPSPSPTPATPSLRIDGGFSSSRPQGQTFAFAGSNFTPLRTVTRWLRQPNGVEVKLTPVLSGDSRGSVSWAFTPTCSTPVGTYFLWIVDDATSRPSNSITETVLRGAQCP
jgi:murein DD-endopeptidase MepM/ murein hydrolase activator NlpD